jgi:hypothetical protein
MVCDQAELTPISTHHQHQTNAPAAILARFFCTLTGQNRNIAPRGLRASLAGLTWPGLLSLAGFILTRP